MSTGQIDSTYRYGAKTFSVPERGVIRIDECPSTIDEQLRRASFEEESSGVFVKTQASLDDNDKEYRVVEVKVDEPTIWVDVGDNVGIVSLTPRSKIQIEPKIDWDHIFDMLLAVHGRKRSVEYHGVPLSRFRRDDVDLEDVFLILAINFLNGLETIHRNGFVRELKTRRADLDDPRGVIDVERTLINQTKARSKTHCLLKEVEHDNAVNSLLHYAGTHLLRLFRHHEDNYEHQAYYHVFSRVHDEVQHLENLGVESGWRRIPEYRRFSLHDLPSQRHYYKNAVDIARAVVASSLGTPSVGGDRELMIDYVLNMESLFEQYTQVAVEEELSAVQSYDHRDRIENVSAVRSPTLQPFDREPQIYHQPDHALEEGDETLAVLDSKYYAEGKDPVKSGGSRSRLFSYAYLLETPHMGFLTPLGEPQSRMVTQTGAELRVIAPEENQFTLDGYHESLQTYLHDALATQYPELDVYRAVEEHTLCIDDQEPAALSRVTDTNGTFGFRNAEKFSFQVVNTAVESPSTEYNTKSDLQQNGDWTRNRIQSQCNKRSSETTTCVPVIRSEWGDEWIDLHFLEQGPDGELVDVTTEGGFKLL
jgi:5-methylcytosine-specific restriction endonuclease McrBC regulatory subunit McrC